MNNLTQRPSVVDLSQRVLDMARTGVYRQSIFDAFQPIATKKTIRLAIARAKQFGLYSVASLRDDELGTYYQVDLAKYQSLRHAIQEAVPPSEQDVLATAVRATQILKISLAVAKSMIIGLLLLAGICGIAGHEQLSLGLFLGASCVMIHWMLQHVLSKPLLNHGQATLSPSAKQ